MRLMLGGGPKHYDGFTNHDMLVDGVDIRYLPESDETVSEIHCHHALEHVSWREIGSTLTEWHRVLISGGKLVISVPDAAGVMRGYLAETNPRLKLVHWGQMLAGPQNGPHAVHLSTLDEHVLRFYLAQAGFEVGQVKHVSNDHNGPGIRMEAMKR